MTVDSTSPSTEMETHDPVSSTKDGIPRTESESIQEAPEPVQQQGGAEEKESSPSLEGDVEAPAVAAATRSSLDKDGGDTDSYDDGDNSDTGDVDTSTGACTNPEVKKRRPLFLFLDSHGCGWLARFPERWPRVFWFIFGVVGPLWLLIFIATICGYGLARLEFPQEITTNDERLQYKTRIEEVNNITNRIMQATPRICMRLYEQNSTAPAEFPQLDTEKGYHESASLLEQATLDFLHEDGDYFNTWIVDGNDLYQFMNVCGKNLQGYVSRIQSFGEVIIDEPDDLTFNWARCTNDSTGTLTGKVTVDIPWIGKRTYSALAPEAQAEYYHTRWTASMEAIKESVYKSLNVSPNATSAEKLIANAYAFRNATRLATGGETCSPNLHSGAWFFFTVMTTIGYGNQAPRTDEGRAMLFTVGFLSILVFAATTAGAGYIMTSIFDDMMKKGHMGCLGKPILATVFWGAVYYIWLLLIAGYTQDWKNTRLADDEFDFGEGYWFAFISTTTVGLGDIYLDPEVIVSQDLLVFSLLFLIGFVFLASFLGSLGSFLRGLEHVGGSSFQRNLEKTTICCGHKVVKATYHVGEEVVKGSLHVGEGVVKGGYQLGENVVKVGHHAYEAGHAKLHHGLHRSKDHSPEKAQQS